ncbi:hypothetical protein LX32DRAFT_254823 [Colletotrichum zoysiae]|uniref:Uncharacterized protein n=1 Tax=Colletotrichum zoysiae TaxID=1216348 RepID=A0AAD9HU10_9PEZI|nr:hypothetical protein LX32DRAFT_254823 [Colletotrichum zoysiae]
MAKSTFPVISRARSTIRGARGSSCRRRCSRSVTRERLPKVFNYRSPNLPLFFSCFIRNALTPLLIWSPSEGFALLASLFFFFGLNAPLQFVPKGEGDKIEIAVSPRM